MAAVGVLGGWLFRGACGCVPMVLRLAVDWALPVGKVHPQEDVPEAQALGLMSVKPQHRTMRPARLKSTMCKCCQSITEKPTRSLAFLRSQATEDLLFSYSMLFMLIFDILDDSEHAVEEDPAAEDQSASRRHGRGCDCFGRRLRCWLHGGGLRAPPLHAGLTALCQAKGSKFWRSPVQRTRERTREAYRWAGYHRQSHFFRHFASLLAESSLEAEQLVEGAVVFGAAFEYQEAFFRAAEAPLLEALPRLTPHQISLVAKGFTAHLTTHHDALLTAVAKLVETQAVEMEPKDVVTMAYSCLLPLKIP